VTSNFTLVNSELPAMIYNQKLADEGPKEARAYLEEIESGSAGFAKGTIQEDWLKTQKAWITYAYI
jgi:hypothetical protein